MLNLNAIAAGWEGRNAATAFRRTHALQTPPAAKNWENCSNSRSVKSTVRWDEQQNLEQVIHLTKVEMGPARFDLVGYFRFPRDQGSVEFVEGN